MTIAVVASQADDRTAFMAMLAPLLPTGMRLAYGMLRNSHEAEDAVQDAAFKAWRSAARFRRDADPRPWFLTIVANECRQRLRSRWWSVSKVTDMPQASGFGSEVDEEAADLRSALRRLPADMRLVLVLRYYLDLPFDKIARTLKCSPQAAKSRTHRALQRLRVEVPKELDT